MVPVLRLEFPHVLMRSFYVVRTHLTQNLLQVVLQREEGWRVKACVSSHSQTTLHPPCTPNYPQVEGILNRETVSS